MPRFLIIETALLDRVARDTYYTTRNGDGVTHNGRGPPPLGGHNGPRGDKNRASVK